eukprot:1297379-Pyramimonas_sp.AAC.1
MESVREELGTMFDQKIAPHAARLDPQAAEPAQVKAKNVQAAVKEMQSTLAEAQAAEPIDPARLADWNWP